MMPCGDNEGKGENARNQHFLLFPQCLLFCPKQISILQSLVLCHLNLLSTGTDLKFCHLAKSSEVTSKLTSIVEPEGTHCSILVVTCIFCYTYTMDAPTHPRLYNIRSK